MSDAKAEAPKKKGKLPIILVLVLVLGGGGFFMMKGKNKPKEEIKLAKTEAMIEIKDEFLVNLYGSDSYLRCKVSLLPDSKAKKEEIEHANPAIVDAIYARLRRTSLEQLNRDEGLVWLRRQLASDLNWTLEHLEAKEAEAAAGDDKKKKKKDEEPVEMTPPTLSTKIDPEEIEHPEWDSDEGPILKVFFTSFATQ